MGSVPQGAHEPTVTDATVSLAVKRVSMNLTEEAYADLQALSGDTRRSMTDIIRFGIALMKLAWDERKRGNRLLVSDSEYKPVREVVLPL